MLKNAIIKTDFSNNTRFYACDFETTTSSIAKDHTYVWSFAVDEIGEFQPEIFGAISDFFDFCGDPYRGIDKRMYFHNLKFDGEFILYEALRRGFRTAYVDGKMLQPRKLINNEMCYAISDMGQWYYIAFRYNNCLCEIRDSLKILPMTLEQIGKSFCKKYRKSTMEYDDKASLHDCTQEDIDYIKNDVLVLSEALDNILQLHGQESKFGKLQSLTIGAACFQHFKQTNYGENKNIEIHLEKEALDMQETGVPDQDAYIRRGYRGGYCYVNPKYKGKLINKKGFTADVNSLYPFVMCGEYSGFSLPYGKGRFYKGKPEEKYIENDSYYFYVRIRTAFKIRKGFVPTIQVKHSFMFSQTEYLTSSAVHDPKNEKPFGKPMEIELTLSKDDYILFCQHYQILKIEHLDYILFMTGKGICDEYIKFFEKVKVEATESGNKGERTQAKLFSNNLYGQFAKSRNSSFKLADLGADGSAHYAYIEAYDKKPINIAIGAAITAHARFYQINTIQDNFDRFIYSDTDSLHCIGNPADFVGRIHESSYGAYKIENTWKRGIFVRQKTYIEECDPAGYLCESCRTHCNWNICCAGMTERQKNYFRKNHQFEDFKPGLFIPGGKLLPMRVPGGVILTEVDFTLK